MDHILVVDDDPDVRLMMQALLRSDDCIIDTADNGRRALSALKKQHYDLMLLDLRMPMNGMLVMARAREQDPNLVIIVFTAHETMESAIEAVRHGAFDYLFKSTPREMIRQRVRAGSQRHREEERRRCYAEQMDLLRETLAKIPEGPAASDERFVRSGPLIMDSSNRSASFSGRMLNLTTAEFDLLLKLVMASPAPMEPSQLVTTLGYQASSQEARETIRVHIHSLRSKIGDDPYHPRCIKTVRHKGYVWCAG